MPVPEPLPPFPDDVLTHPLLIIDYQLIKEKDAGEIDKLWEAATKLGFWYLKNHGADDLVNEMFELGKETMALPMEEKMKFEQGDEGMSFGYKAAGANAVDATGEQDTVEFLNIAKDDALSYPTIARRTYPSTATARMKSTITPFVRKSLEVNLAVIEIFNQKLGLPEGTLVRMHSEEEYSASEARVIKNPAIANANKQAIGSHTDFGSLSFLHNRLGGLQVLVPGAESWQYVKPIPNHAICNIGDALSILSGGILRSNLHRVVPPPGRQAGQERWSVVFFTRPGNSVVLRPFADESSIIESAVKKLDDETRNRLQTGTTSFEWFSRRIRNQRINNRKGPETWMASRGTEHRVEA